MKRTCKQCGGEFIISNSEIAFYKQRKLALPKRCKNCREQNKHKKTQDGQDESVEQVSEYKAEKMQLKQESISQKQDGFRKEPSKIQKKDSSRKEQSKSQKQDGFRNETSKSQKKDEFRNESSNQQSNTNSRKQYSDAVEATQKQTVEQKPKKTLKQKIAYSAVALMVLLAGGTGAASLSGNSANVEESGYVQEAETQTENVYTFRNEEMLQDHYEKHGIEMGFASAEEYEKAANAVCNNPEAKHKIESEDGDDVYYIEATNEFVVVSTDGYLRTYFHPEDGLDYFNRQ